MPKAQPITTAGYIACNYLLNGANALTLGIFGHQIQAIKQKSTDLADLLNIKYEAEEGKYNADKIYKQTNEYITALQKLITDSTNIGVNELTASIGITAEHEQIVELNNLITQTISTTGNTKTEINNLKNKLDDLTTDLQCNSDLIASDPTALIDIMLELDKVEKSILNTELTKVDALFTNQAFINALGDLENPDEKLKTLKKQMRDCIENKHKEALETYGKTINTEFNDNLKLISDLAHEERQLMIALSKAYSSPEDLEKLFLENNNEEGEAIIDEENPRPYTLKTFASLFIDKDGNSIPVKTLTGMECIYNKESDTLSMTIPRHLFSLSFYHSDPDDRVAAEFEFLARARKVMHNSDKKDKKRDEIKFTIGKTNKYAISSSQQDAKKTLYEEDKMMCMKAIKGSLNAGYALEKITIIIHGRKINAENLMEELKLDNNAISEMQKTAQEKKTQATIKRTLQDLTQKYVPQPTAQNAAHGEQPDNAPRA
jgi:hypothetical protein